MNFKNKKYIFGLLLFVSFFSNAQKSDIEKLREKYRYSYVITEPGQKIELDTLELFLHPKFKSSYTKRYYLWLKKKTYRAYPFAVLAKEKIQFLNDTIQQIKSKRKSKRYIKKKQRLFEEEFAKSIKKLTKTEGRVLIKLIYRLTGISVNEHVQDKRGKLKAFWYRFSASFFKIDLKAEYHPESLMEDYMIESILRQAFVNEDLEEEMSVLENVNSLRFDRVIQVEKKK